jgi:hypothetical protein
MRGANVKKVKIQTRRLKTQMNDRKVLKWTCRNIIKIYIYKNAVATQLYFG